MKDVLEKFFTHPLSYKSVWRANLDMFQTDLDRQRFYPGVELLCVQRAREMGDAMAPEFVHELRGNKRWATRREILTLVTKEPESLTNQRASSLIRCFFDVDSYPLRHPQ